MASSIVVGQGANGQPQPVGATADRRLMVDVGDETSTDPLQQIASLLGRLLLEIRATRLAVEELVNAGATEQTDFLELAQDLADEED